MGDKRVSKVLKHNMTLIAVFSKQMKNKKQQSATERESCSPRVKKSGNSAMPMLSMQDFDKIKVIGKGGFAEKVYLARKKDTGSLYAIKTMSKKFIMEEQGRYE